MLRFAVTVGHQARRICARRSGHATALHTLLCVAIPPSTATRNKATRNHCYPIAPAPAAVEAAEARAAASDPSAPDPSAPDPAEAVASEYGRSERGMSEKMFERVMSERMLELSNSEWAAECMVASSPVGPKGSSKGSTGPAVPAAASSSPVALPAAAPSVLGQAFAEWQINGFVAAGTTLSATAIHVVPPAILPIARWRFDDGMCFGANSKWWGDLGQRYSAPPRPR